MEPQIKEWVKGQAWVRHESGMQFHTPSGQMVGILIDAIILLLDYIEHKVFWPSEIYILKFSP